MGAIRDAVAGVEKGRGGQPHQLKRLLDRIDAEDAADIVSLLKEPATSLTALRREVESRFEFVSAADTWLKWARQARNGDFDAWVS